MMDGLSHPYHLDESSFVLRGIGSNFSFYFIFRRKSCKQVEWPQMGRCVLRLYILPISHKKDARLIWVKQGSYLSVLLASTLVYNF